MNPEPRIYLQDGACPLCGSPLTVTSTSGTTVTYRDERFVLSTYECRGRMRHRIAESPVTVDGVVTSIAQSLVYA